MWNIARARGFAWRCALGLLLALGALLRLFDLNDPPLDFHPTRQLRNSLVARSIYYDAWPQASSEQRLQAQTFRRAVGLYEPPIMESLVGFTFLITGESFAVPRLYQTAFWLLAGLALFDLARRTTSVPGALVGLGYFLILPFAVQGSRSFQPDPLMTAAFAVGIYFLHRWSEEHEWKWALLAGALLGFSALVKIVSAFMIGAAVIAVLLSLGISRTWRSKQVWALAGLMVLPALLYYVVARPGRATEYFFAWTVALIGLVTSPDFYSKWLAFLGSLFGLTMLTLSLLGAIFAQPRLRAILIGSWAGYVVYGLTLPFQMYTHSYYHLQLLPVAALGIAALATPLMDRIGTLDRFWRAAAVGLVTLAAAYEAWVARSVLVAEDFRQEPAFWQEVGRAIPDSAEVIALTQDYGYRLMYWGWKKVDLWPITTELSGVRGGTQDPVADFASLTDGMDYFLVTAFGQLDKQPGLSEVLSQLPVAAEGPGYVLYDLRE